MGITFGKRKLKIKIMKDTETANEELNQPHNEQFHTVPKTPQMGDEKAVETKKKTGFKDLLQNIYDITINKLNLSDFTVYTYYYSDNRYQFSKIMGRANLNEIQLEKYLSFGGSTIIRRASGLSESGEYRSRLVTLMNYRDNDYILIWSSILYEIFDDEKISEIKKIMEEMRD